MSDTQLQKIAAAVNELDAARKDKPLYPGMGASQQEWDIYTQKRNHYVEVLDAVGDWEALARQLLLIALAAEALNDNVDLFAHGDGWPECIHCGAPVLNDGRVTHTTDCLVKALQDRLAALK